MPEYIPLETAQEILLSHTTIPAGALQVPLGEAAGRVLAGEVEAAIPQPPFDRSPLDGYALRSRDCAGATPKTPVSLEVVGEIFAGDAPGPALGPGQAVWIMTGAPMPPGADCVIRQEDTHREGAGVKILHPLGRHQNYCFAGEDVPRGSLLLGAGVRLDWAAVAVLAGQGLTGVPVFPGVEVGVLSTGSELVAAGQPLGPGKIYDSNGPLISGRIEAAGGVARLLPAVEDDPVRLADCLAPLLESCPLVVTTGGVSVGARDHMPQVAQLLGAERLFHGVAVKPGAPVLACRRGNSLLLALSGNPFAAMVGFELLGLPVLRKLMGLQNPFPQRVRGRLQSDFAKGSGGRRFLRGRLAGGDIFLPGGHASGMLASLMGCNCLVDIPAGSPPCRWGMRRKF